MEFDLERAQELFDKGHFSSISHAIGPDVAHLKRAQPPEFRILVAQACVYTGRLKAAMELLDTLSGMANSPSVQAASHIVLGLIKKREGRIEEALTQFRIAIRIARGIDRKQLAWAQAHLFRLLSDGNAEHELAALLADARSAAAQAGDPHITAYLRDSVAVMETARGRTLEAERHLRVARSLLSIRPNAWLEQLIALDSSCIAVLECDSNAFSTYSSNARALAQITGHVNSERALQANDAYVALMSGDFTRADALLQAVLKFPATGQIELAALESVSRMHLALGELDRCAESLNKLDTFKRQHRASSYCFRTAAVTRMRLLIRRHEFDAAVALADRELVQFATVNDVPSKISLTTLKAVALAMLGRTAECSRALLDANLMGATQFRDQHADYSHGCSAILSQNGIPASRVFVSRSFRVWQAHGNQYSPIEAITADGTVATTEAEAKLLLRNHFIQETPLTFAPGEQALVINHLAAAFDLAYSPKLLAEELTRVVRGCDLSAETKVFTKAVPANLRASSRSLSLGEHAGTHYTLTCETPDDPMKSILLGDVLRIGRAAVALERAREEERNRAALWPADPIEDQNDAIFIAEAMQSLLAKVRRIAPTTVPVLITGETGTGKEVLARTIHACSKRVKNVFLPFNCASTPKDMLDSQLFGHRRGAFTGAVEHFQGVVRAAAGGTLFLDEIGDTSLDVQPKLLRFLDSSEVHAIGEAHPTRVDVRVIVATNADLDRLVGEGRFREDLFYRLSIVPLHIPPLRERRVEIPALANHYLRKHAQECGKGDLRLSEDTMEYLVLYKWPGNVRQLASEMRRLAALAETDAVLMPEHLSPEIAASRRTLPPSERALDANEVVVRLDQPMAAATQHLEQAMLQYALKKCDGRIEETANMLGISRKGLYLKRQRFGIDPPGEARMAVGA